MWSAMLTERTPKRLVKAILKTTKQRITSRAMLMLGVISTIVVSQLWFYVETKNNTTEDSVAVDNSSAVGNKQDPITDSARDSQNNPAEDHVVSNDHIGCDFNNSYELAWELSEDFAVNLAMGSIYTSPLSILAN